SSSRSRSLRSISSFSISRFLFSILLLFKNIICVLIGFVNQSRHFACAKQSTVLRLTHRRCCRFVQNHRRLLALAVVASLLTAFARLLSKKFADHLPAAAIFGLHIPPQGMQCSQTLFEFLAGQVQRVLV